MSKGFFSGCKEIHNALILGGWDINCHFDPFFPLDVNFYLSGKHTSSESDWKRPLLMGQVAYKRFQI